MKLKRCRKALSPVVASIILIAVTVAVSIAVAAWMGALTFSFTATEQGQITFLQFNTAAAPNNNILVTFNNTGTSAITITEVWVNSVQIPNANIAVTTGTTPATQLGTSCAANTGFEWTITLTGTTVTGGVVASGDNYQVELVSAKGNKFLSSGSAPS